MLGIILIYYLGKQFYTLAEANQRNKWGYAIAGILSYYASTVVGLVIIIVGIGSLAPDLIDPIPEYAYDLIGIPFGLLGTWLFYRYLKQKFEGNNLFHNTNNDLLDDELT
jgi:purine-cytosine permease-like protein